jgi:hypothetical protein
MLERTYGGALQEARVVEAVVRVVIILVVGGIIRKVEAGDRDGDV